MTPELPPSRASIGATLRDARRRYGLEVREVEERTKIRARYIRALENEDWETLPAPAYVRGFLRTYGQLLGLDGDMLADEYRRTYGDAPANNPSGSAASEPLLSERRRPGERRPPSRGVIIAAVIVGIVALIFVLGLLSGDDEGGGDGGGGDGGGKAAKSAKGNGGGGGGGGDGKPKLEPETAVIVAKTSLDVCLVGDGKEALIDSQQLAEGAREEYEGYELYRLDVGPGEARFEVGDDSEEISVSEDASFEADSTGIRQIDPAGPDCP